jgi:transposase
VALVELSVVEQRYHAVMEVLAGMSVTEVAERYGVHCNSVHEWVRRYERGGLAALADRSHRPEHHPWQISPEIEAAICELRRTHSRWGPRRLQHELDRRGVEPLPSLSSIGAQLPRRGTFTQAKTRGLSPLGARRADGAVAARHQRRRHARGRTRRQARDRNRRPLPFLRHRPPARARHRAISRGSPTSAPSPATSCGSGRPATSIRS